MQRRGGDKRRAVKKAPRREAQLRVSVKTA
jgi:hypothetical protein